MAVSMAAMMAPTAAPFFFAYGRDSRRPLAVGTVVLVYLAVWAAIGLVLAYLMNQVMVPSSVLALGAALGIALVWAVTPWGRWGREQCRLMAMRVPRAPRFRDALLEGASYTACCVACSAGLMLVVVVLGMSNPLVLAGGAAVMLTYKLVAWRAPYSATISLPAAVPSQSVPSGGRARGESNDQMGDQEERRGRQDRLPVADPAFHRP